MKFIIDMQLPRALSRALRNAGHDAEHARGTLPARAPDTEIWRLAIERKAAIITKDEDFIVMVGRQPVVAPVVWLRCGNLSNADLLPLVIDRLPFICSTIDQGALIVEIR